MRRTCTGSRAAHRRAGAAGARGAGGRAALRPGRHRRRRSPRSHRARRPRPRWRRARRSRPGSATSWPTVRPGAPPAGSAPATAAEAVDEGVQASWIAARAGLAMAVARPVLRRAADRVCSPAATPRSPDRPRSWLRIAALGRSRDPARDGRQRLDARRAGHPPTDALRARARTCLSGALPGPRLSGRAGPGRLGDRQRRGSDSSAACCSSARWSPNA